MPRTLAAAVVAVACLLAVAGPALAAPPAGLTTVNLRTCVDAGDGACLTSGDVAVDGAWVCLKGPGIGQRCGGTEDGELWWDSLASKPYRASIEVPAGYRLAGITCTTFPNVPSTPCRVRGSEVRFSFPDGTPGLNISFLLVPA